MARRQFLVTVGSRRDRHVTARGIGQVEGRRLRWRPEYSGHA